MQENKTEKLFLLAIILSMCVWGFSWSSAKVLTAYASPSSLAFLRFLFVPITLIPLCLLLKIDIKVKLKGLPYLLGAGIFMMIYTLCFFKGVSLGMAGAGGVLVTTLNPLFAYLVGLVIDRILPQKKEFIGLFIGLMAGFLLLQIWQKADLIFAFGNSFFLFAAFIWAVMSKFSAHANRFGNAIGFTIWLHIITLAGLCFMVDFQEINNIIKTEKDIKFWANLFYFGIVNSSLATTVYLFATAKIGAEKASTYIFIVPAMAALGSFLFLDEHIYWHTILGGTLGILAVFIINGKFNFLSAQK
jgi:drug/metabolite transporter (DMT)-like permease